MARAKLGGFGRELVVAVGELTSFTGRVSPSAEDERRSTNVSGGSSTMQSWNDLQGGRVRERGGK